MNPGGRNAISEIYSDIVYQHSIKNLTNLQVCREPILTIPIVIYTRKHFYLLHAMNDKIESLKGAGLIEYWYSIQLTNEFTRDDGSPKILTLDHLSGCFQIWVGGCLFSFVVFTSELMVYKWKIRVKGIK